VRSSLKDAEIGSLFAKLKEKGVWENTIVIVTSSSGADGNHGFSSRCPVWATVGNTPYHGSHRTSLSGGRAVPLIVHYPPGTAKEVRGSFEKQFCSVLDIAPTIFELTGTATPKTDPSSRPLLSQTGRSIASVLQGKLKPTDSHFISDGRIGSPFVVGEEWSMHASRDAKGKGTYCNWKLFKTADDPYERRDLAAEQPEVVARLDKLFVEWAKKRQSSVLPEFEGKKDWTAAEAASLKALVPPALRDAPAK